MAGRFVHAFGFRVSPLLMRGMRWFFAVFTNSQAVSASVVMTSDLIYPASFFGKFFAMNKRGDLTGDCIMRHSWMAMGICAFAAQLYAAEETKNQSEATLYGALA